MTQLRIQVQVRQSIRVDSSYLFSANRRQNQIKANTDFFFYFFYFFIKFISISILRLQTFRLNRFYERKWKGQDIVKLILCPLLDEVNLF